MFFLFLGFRVKEEFSTFSRVCRIFGQTNQVAQNPSTWETLAIKLNFGCEILAFGLLEHRDSG